MGADSGRPFAEVWCTVDFLTSASIPVAPGSAATERVRGRREGVSAAVQPGTSVTGVSANIPPHAQGRLSMKKLYAIAIVASSALLGAQSGQQGMVEWPHWGGDAAQPKYSTPGDITPANVRDLELAWTWKTVDEPMPDFDVRP